MRKRKVSNTKKIWSFAKHEICLISIVSIKAEKGKRTLVRKVSSLLFGKTPKQFGAAKLQAWIGRLYKPKKRGKIWSFAKKI